jgi:hypothetical protein
MSGLIMIAAVAGAAVSCTGIIITIRAQARGRKQREARHDACDR